MSVPTILDYLNEDCWRLVLGYVPLPDIFRSEGTSRRWERMVLTYLAHVRLGINVKYPFPECELTGVVQNVRWAKLADDQSNQLSFGSWIQKHGAFVVATYCNAWSYQAIGENCPNLEVVMFLNVPEELLLKSQYKNFHELQIIRFIDCHSMSDVSLKQFLVSPVLEDLLISINDKVTGECFMHLQSTNFKALDLKYCEALGCRHLAAARDRLSGLTMLSLEVINTINIDTSPEAGDEPLDDILLVLEKTEKLEHLISTEFGKYVDNFLESVCRLRCLRVLEIDIPGTDEGLEALVRCCPELKILKFRDCEALTGRGLRAVCALAGARLVELSVPHSHYLTDDDVEACVRACPNLKELDVSYGRRLSRGMLPRAAAARREVGARVPLRLLWISGSVEDRAPIEKFEELDLPCSRWMT